MLIMGQLDEPADVAIATNSNPAVDADVDINHVFKAYADVIDGSNTLTVTATDKSGNNNQTTTNYSFSVSADTFTDPVYDADGNMLQDGTGRSYVWDQESRLNRINYSSGEYTTFAYNAYSQRIRKTEYNSSGTPTSDIAYIWCSGTQPCEERDFNTQTTVLARYYPQGEERIGGADAGDYYYFQDHLGSVSEMVDSSENVRSQYAYDPYGRQSANLITTNPLDAQFGYTGHFQHQQSGLVLTWYRAYDPELGIWLSRDPIAESGGLNLYGYVANNPVNYWDPDGLSTDKYVPDQSKHGGAHVDRYTKNGQNVGRYRPDGSGMKFKGKFPPKIPKSDMGKFLKAVDRLVGPLNALMFMMNPKFIHMQSLNDCPDEIEVEDGEAVPDGYIPYPSFTPEDAEKNKGRYVRRDLWS